MARDALMNAKIGETVKQIAKGAAEMAGLKAKTGVAETPSTKNSGASGTRP